MTIPKNCPSKSAKTTHYHFDPWLFLKQRDKFRWLHIKVWVTGKNQWADKFYAIHNNTGPFVIAGIHNPRVGSRPERVISVPQSRSKNTRNFSRMTDILWMNLNFIKLLAILQIIAIRNSSDGNNIKPQAIKGYLDKINLILDSWKFDLVFSPRVH